MLLSKRYIEVILRCLGSDDSNMWVLNYFGGEIKDLLTEDEANTLEWESLENSSDPPPSDVEIESSMYQIFNKEYIYVNKTSYKNEMLVDFILSSKRIHPLINNVYIDSLRRKINVIVDSRGNTKTLREALTDGFRYLTYK